MLAGGSPMRPAAPDRPRTPHVLLLPTLNEEHGLSRTLEQLAEVPFRGSVAPPEVVVVDGHSTDGTRRIAEEHGLQVLEQTGRGKGAAVREGLLWARTEGFDSVAVMDADATYPASSLPALFALLDLGRDLVVGVRRPDLPPSVSLRDLVHRVGNGLLNYTAAQLSRKPVHDICSGFWGVRTEHLHELALESSGFDIEAELFIKGFRRGLRVAQIPVRYSPRVGEAKLHAVRDGSRIFLAILRYSLRTGRPLGGATPGTGPHATARGQDLNSMLLSLNPDRVVLLASPERLPEADGMARYLHEAMPQAAIVTAAPADLRPILEEGTPFPGLIRSPGGRGSMVVVAYPAELPGGPGGGVLLGIPRTQRFLWLEGQRSAARRPARAAGFRRERVPHGPLGAWFILGATLEPSWTQRELALLSANARATDFRAYRRPSRP
jgi:hypothetical protein